MFQWWRIIYICTHQIYIYVSFQFWLFICKVISSFAFLTLTVLVKAWYKRLALGTLFPAPASKTSFLFFFFVVARQNGRRHEKNYIYRYLRLRVHTYIYIYIHLRWDTNSNGKKKDIKKKRKDRSCILQPRSNGIPDLCSHTSRKPDPYRTSAICHTAPEQTSFRSSINHFFFSLSSFISFSSRSPWNQLDRVVCCRSAFTDRAHASIIFPAAKLVHPPLDAPPRFPWPRRQRRLTQ